MVCCWFTGLHGGTLAALQELNIPAVTRYVRLCDAVLEGAAAAAAFATRAQS